MIDFEPKFITFDMYGTLTAFGMSALTRELMADRVPADRMDSFLDDFESWRGDEILGDWRPYPDVIRNALRKTCDRWNLPFRESDAQAIVEAVPTWGPHPDVPEGLQALASRYPLVILSNAANDQVMGNVEKLGAPFHAVYTAEDAQAYKPRLQAFEYMLGELGVGPGDILHVSSSPWHDLIPCHQLHIANKVYVNRGWEPSTPDFYGYHEVTSLTEVPALLGI